MYDLPAYVGALVLVGVIGIPGATCAVFYQGSLRGGLGRGRAAALAGGAAVALGAPGGVARLALPHTFRIVGVVFLIVMGLRHLPAAFAVPAGLGDIAYRPLDVTPSTEPLSLLPLALVATLAVPLAVALHVVSLRLLATAPRTQRRVNAQPPAPILG